MVTKATGGRLSMAYTLKLPHWRFDRSFAGTKPIERGAASRRAATEGGAGPLTGFRTA